MESLVLRPKDNRQKFNVLLCSRSSCVLLCGIQLELRSICIAGSESASLKATTACDRNLIRGSEAEACSQIDDRGVRAEGGSLRDRFESDNEGVLLIRGMFPDGC